MTTPTERIRIGLEEFEAARARVSAHAYHTPLLTSRLLSERTGFDVRLKAEIFQRTGSYKIRGPLNKLPQLTDEQRRRGVICSSAGNHAQGVALAAKIHGVRAVVVMAENATPQKSPPRAHTARRSILHGQIWDEANEKMKQLAAEHGFTVIHPFDDLQLITGQGTLGLEIHDDFPGSRYRHRADRRRRADFRRFDGAQGRNPKIRVIGVESSDGPAMKRSIEAGMRHHA